MAEPSDPEQCSNEDGFWPSSSSFGAQMRPERLPMRGFPLTNLGAGLVSPLPVRRIDDSGKKRVVNFESSSEVVCHVRGNDPRLEGRVENGVPSRDVTVTETAYETATGQTERLRTMVNEPSDDVKVFSMSNLNGNVLLFWRSRCREPAIVDGRRSLSDGRRSLSGVRHA